MYNSDNFIEEEVPPEMKEYDELAEFYGQLQACKKIVEAGGARSNLIYKTMEKLEDANSDQLEEIEDLVEEALGCLDDAYAGEESIADAVGKMESAKSKASLSDVSRSVAKDVASERRKAEAYDVLIGVAERMLHSLRNALSDVNYQEERADRFRRERNQLKNRVEASPFLDT